MKFSTLLCLIPFTCFAMDKPNKYLFYNYKERFTPQELEKHHLEDPYLKRELDTLFKQGSLISSDGKATKLEINGQQYYIKSELSRIIGASLINDLANEYQLAVNAPIKKIYRDPSGKEYCLVPVIPSVERKFTLKQMRDICKVFEVSGFDDTVSDNVINTKDGTVYFIDTEEQSFTAVKDYKQYSLDQKELALDTFKQTAEITVAGTKFISKEMRRIRSIIR